MYSTSSLASSTNNFDFKGAVISPVKNVIVEMNALPFPAAFVSGICEIVILTLVYYYCGYLAVIPFIVGKLVMRGIQFVVCSSSHGLLQTVQQRLLCE